MKEKIRHLVFESNIFMTVLVALTFAGVTLTAIFTGQSFLRILPLYISLMVYFLNSKVNRYGLLIGSANSILYGIVDMHYHLYGSALQAFFVSFPIQLVTFILWSKRSYKKSTLLRVMSTKLRLLTAIGSIAAYVIYVFVMKDTDATYLYLDGIGFISGIVLPIITMFAFIEYAYVPLFTALVSTLMRLLFSMETPEQLPFFVFSIYSYICQIMQLYNVRKLYKEQQSVGADNLIKK